MADASGFTYAWQLAHSPDGVAGTRGRYSRADLYLRPIVTCHERHPFQVNVVVCKGGLKRAGDKNNASCAGQTWRRPVQCTMYDHDVRRKLSVAREGQGKVGPNTSRPICRPDAGRGSRTQSCPSAGAGVEKTSWNGKGAANIATVAVNYESCQNPTAN